MRYFLKCKGCGMSQASNSPYECWSCGSSNTELKAIFNEYGHSDEGAKCDCCEGKLDFDLGVEFSFTLGDKIVCHHCINAEQYMKPIQVDKYELQIHSAYLEEMKEVLYDIKMVANLMGYKMGSQHTAAGGPDDTDIVNYHFDKEDFSFNFDLCLRKNTMEIEQLLIWSGSANLLEESEVNNYQDLMEKSKKFIEYLN